MQNLFYSIITIVVLILAQHSYSNDLKYVTKNVYEKYLSDGRLVYLQETKVYANDDVPKDKEFFINTIVELYTVDDKRQKLWYRRETGGNATDAENMFFIHDVCIYNNNLVVLRTTFGQLDILAINGRANAEPIRIRIAFIPNPETHTAKLVIAKELNDIFVFVSGSDGKAVYRIQDEQPKIVYKTDEWGRVVDLSPRKE